MATGRTGVLAAQPRRRLFWQDEKGESVRSLFSSLTSHSSSNLQDFAEKSLTRSGFSRKRAYQCSYVRASAHVGGQNLPTLNVIYH
jgi:hypothetical protein